MTNEEITALKKACKGKRAKFVEEYIKDGNGTAAVIRAGVTDNRESAAVTASRWLREPEVLAYRDALVESAADAVGICRESLILKAEKIYRRCIQEVAVLNADGEETGMFVFDAKNALKAAELQAKLVGTLSESRVIDGGGFEFVFKPKE